MSKSTKLKNAISAAVLLTAVVLVAYLVYVPDAKARVLGLFSPAASPSPSAASAFPEESATPAVAATENALYICFLNVGQGDCAFLRSPSGKTMLIDAGEAEEADAVLAFLEEQNVAELDLLIASHTHSDHVGAMPYVIYSHSPKTFVLPKGALCDGLLSSALTAREAVVLPADSETELVWDEEIDLELLSPLPGVKYSDENQGSLMLRVSYGNTSVLFAGDAGYEAEDIALRAQDASLFRADVLKLGHHGSSDATTPRFLRAVQPQYAVVSCGINNSYGHPHQSVLNQLAHAGVQVWRTDMNGNIYIVMDGNSVTMSSER